MANYRLTLQRGSIVCTEVFNGSKFELLLYRFKMRKWKIIKIEEI